MWQKLAQRLLSDRSFGTKLSVLLLGVTAIPIVLVTHGMLKVAENRLTENLQDKLQNDLLVLENGFQRIERNNMTVATTLSSGVQLAQLDLSDPTTITSHKTQLEAMLWLDEASSRSASFYIFTNAQGQAIVQGTRAIPPEISMDVPIAGPPHPDDHHFDLPHHGIWSIGVTSSKSLTALPIVYDALRQQTPRSGIVILQPEQLQLLGLAAQAKIGIQPQKTQGLPLEKQPMPLNTYDTQQGQVGLVSFAVYPIHRRYFIKSRLSSSR
jgi:hypothetical protein